MSFSNLSIPLVESTRYSRSAKPSSKQTPRDIRKGIVGYQSQAQNMHAHNLRMIKKLHADLIINNKMCEQASSASTNLQPAFSTGSFPEVSLFSSQQQEIKVKPVASLESIPEAVEQMRGSIVVQDNYLIRGSINVQKSTEKVLKSIHHSQQKRPIRFSQLGIKTSVRSSVIFGSTPSNSNKQNVRSSLDGFNTQHIYSKAFEIKGAESERLSYDVGVENRIYPIEARSGFRKTLLNSCPLKQRQNWMGSISCERLSKSAYRPVKLAVFVPEDTECELNLSKLVNLAAMNGLVLIKLDD